MVLKNIDKTIVIIMLIVIILSACSSQKSIISESETESSSIIAQLQTSNEDNADFDNDSQHEEKTTKNKDLKYPEIEKVIIKYFNSEEEITEKQQSFDFLDNIRRCDTVPETHLTMKIGDIKIKYFNKEKESDFAVLYLGTDGGIYAKHIKSVNKDYAYRIK